MTGRENLFDKGNIRPAAQPPNLHDAPRKRNRQWEKQQQSRKAVYRGVDPNLALKVRRIADDLQTSAGEVACTTLEYALRSYERGDFDLYPHPNPERRRMTLLPRANPISWTGNPQRVPKRKQPEAVWRVITTWRGFSPELKKEIAALASEDGLHVPIGELVTELLRFGLNAYDTGLLTLTLKPKSSAFPLGHKDKR